MLSRRAIVLSACALVAVVTWAGERAVLEAILVRVNDRIVTISGFRDRLRQELSQLAEQPEGEDLRQYAEGLFDSLVDEMILLERAQERRVEVADEDVDEAIAALRADKELAEEAAFAAALEGAGLTLDGLRARYRQSMLVHRTVQAEVQPTEITVEELRAVYEEEKENFRVPAKVELRQLFFPFAANGSDRAQVLERARGLVDRVSQGADLAAEATLAGVEVQDLGAIPEGDLRPELRDALVPLQEGQLAGPIVIPGGAQVIRLVHRVPEGFQPFDDVKELLRRRESQRSFQMQTRGLVDKLKEEYLVEVHRELLEEAIQGL